MRTVVIALLLTSASPAVAGKGGGAVQANPQVAYRVLSGKSVKLLSADETGSNASAIYSSPTSFRFDLGPRDSGRVAVADGPASTDNGSLFLVNVSKSASGTLIGSTPIRLTDARRGSNVDFSPDGNKIAYKCCWNGTTETLAVYDIQSGTVTPWAQAPYFWDLGWFRNGTTLVYSTYGPSEVYEVPAPLAPAQLLFRARPDGGGEINLDAVHNDANALLLSYNDLAGNARIGRWQAPTNENPDGHFLETDLAGTTVAFFGNLNCNDTKLAYLGAPNSSGIQVWYIRDLSTGVRSTFLRDSNIMLQYWPTC